MKNKNTLLQLAILIILLLAMGIAFWRSNSSQSAAVNGVPSAVKDRIGQRRWSTGDGSSPAGLETLKNQEFLGIEPETEPVVLPSGRTVGAMSKPTSKTPSSKVSAKLGEPYRPGQRPVHAGANGNVYQVASTSVGGSNARSGYQSMGGGPRAVSGLFTGSKNVDLPVDEKTKQMFSPFLGGLTKQQAAALNQSLNGLSSRVERAIYHAMLPKSKKDANIEKYLQRNRVDGTETIGPATGPFAEVINQVSSQKAGIMKSMGNAYGSAAAKDAGKVMDAYQSELASVLNNVGNQTPEQLADKARQISQKYNKELEKVSQKRGLEKYSQDLQAKDQEFLQNFEKMYGGDNDLAGKVAQLQQQARTQKEELFKNGGSYNEMFAKQTEIERSYQENLRKMLAENGYSLKGLDKLDQEQVAKELEARRRAQEEGKALPMAYRLKDEEVAKIKENIPDSPTLQKTYGTQGAALLQPIYQNYDQKVDGILRNPETSREEKNDELFKAYQELQTQLRTPEVQKMQVDANIDQIIQGTELSRATPEQKEGFKQHAQPILQEMYRRINAISDSDLPEPEKKHQIEAAQRQAEQQLFGGASAQ